MIMSQCVMIFGAHLDSLTQEPFCVSSSNYNHVTLQIPFPPHSPNTGIIFFPFWFSNSHFCSFALFCTIHTPFFPDYYASLINIPLRLLPASADCQCLQVNCGHFLFIILSKSGMALAQGDWVSVKHQELIEFVLKWLIEGTLLMQS